MSTTTQTWRARLRPVAIPNEHGGWGFLLEPLLLGLLVAPSWAGVWIAVAALGAFLARHPLRLTLTDWRRGRRFNRTRLAERFVLFYGGLAAAGLILAALTAGPEALWPLLFATPLLMTHLTYEMRGDTRQLLPELTGPAALAANAACITLAGGWQPDPALALWIIVVARAIPSVLYVRARLRLERGQTAPIGPALVTQAAGIAFVALLALAGLTHWLAVLALTLLLARAAYGLSSYRRRVPAKIVGFQEIGYGLLTVLLVALGYGLAG